MNNFAYRLQLHALCLLLSSVANAQIVLPRLIGDGMVLQRDTEITVWGWASPEESISLELNGRSYITRAEENGEWEIDLAATAAGGPYTITLQGKNEIILKNVVFGDVWLCTGQSNMVHQMKLHRVLYAEDIATADFPDIRHFAVPTHGVLTGPAKDFSGGSWQAATPDNVRDFTAVGYFFALDLYKKYGIPIGLINASVGGSPIEAWISEKGLSEFPSISNTVERNKDTAYVNRINAEPDPESETRQPKDRGLVASPPWYAEELVENRNWGRINVPGYWEDQGAGGLDGTVWYRKTVQLPATMSGKEAEVFLGRIVDADELYINGKRIGGTGYQYPQRRYAVPVGLLRAGENLFTVRVTNFAGKGGFVSDRPYEIHTLTDTVDLKGTWKYRVGQVQLPRRTSPPPRISSRSQPASFYNGMIAPAVRYAIKGVLWYQGESNAGRPESYAALQKAQITDFRTKWGNENLPFFFVQLPGYQDFSYLPTQSNWAELREAQRRTLLLPNTGMAIAIDLGEWNDIHPDNKKDVGLRLARLARQQVYGERDLVASGPLPLEANINGDKITLTFSNVGTGLVSQDGEPLREFTIAGYDGIFHRADAKIVGDKVEIMYASIQYPRYLRYAWSDNPRVNLYNETGLPASPFEMTVGTSLPPLWMGKKAAVVLTYDDALEVHLDDVIPQLDQLGLKATFYLSAAFPGSKNRLNGWRQAAANSHELGNHTLYHPCDASKPGRDWVAAERDLSSYTIDRLLEEIDMTNIFLESLDGKKERTFAYPCGDTLVGAKSFVKEMDDLFVSSRGVGGETSSPKNTDFQYLGARVADGHSAEEMISWVKEVEDTGSLLTLVFHGVGGGHDINVASADHRRLVEYLSQSRESIWTTTMIDAARHLKERLKSQ